MILSWMHETYNVIWLFYSWTVLFLIGELHTQYEFTLAISYKLLMIQQPH